MYNSNSANDSFDLLEDNNYVRGTIGALLGALIGAVPWAVVLYFGWFVGWLGFVIGFCAKKGYELMGGKKGKFKIFIVCLSSILGVIVGNTAWDLIEFGLLISSGEIVGYTYWDIPQLYFGWLENPDVAEMVIKNLLLGFVFAALGLWSFFKQMVKDTNAPQSADTPDSTPEE